MTELRCNGTLLRRILVRLSPSLSRRAFREQDVEASRHAHGAHSHHEHHSASAEYLPDFVLGGIDGIITTFAVVAGVVGAHLSNGVIIVLGAANLLADGLSMAVGNYLGAKSEQDYFRSERQREIWEIEHIPEHEKEEIREIYEGKGFSGDLLNRVVDHIVADKKLWVDTMMRDELNIIEDRKDPFIVGAVTFVAFLVFGFIPLTVFVGAIVLGAGESTPLFEYCLGATGSALFCVGALRARFTFRSWIRSGVEILLLGGAAGAVAYYVGVMLRGLA